MCTKINGSKCHFFSLSLFRVDGIDNIGDHVIKMFSALLASLFTEEVTMGGKRKALNPPEEVID